jgi:pimeloyl-ACP methyl ester carboxylesterase
MLTLTAESPSTRLDRARPEVPPVVLTRDGVRVAVRDSGPADADRTVVLLHGLCQSAQSWAGPARFLSARLGDDVRIIGYDHRGHGESSRAPMATYHVEQLADDLADVLAILGVRGEVTLAGHSLGGMTAVTYCARRADLLPVQPCGLVLVATAAGGLATRGIGRLLGTPAPGLLAALVAHAPAAAAEQALRALVGPLSDLVARCGGCGSAEREALCALSADALATTAVSTAAGFLLALRRYDQTGALGAIRARTTVLSGGADLLTPHEHAEELVAGIAGATHRHFPRAGHMLLHQAPREVAEAITETVLAARTPHAAAVTA